MNAIKNNLMAAAVVGATLAVKHCRRCGICNADHEINPIPFTFQLFLQWRCHAGEQCCLNDLKLMQWQKQKLLPLPSRLERSGTDQKSPRSGTPGARQSAASNNGRHPVPPI